MEYGDKKETAIEAFGRNYREVLENIGTINKLVAEAKNKAHEDPKNWGHAGSMAHVNEELKNIVAFLSGTER